MRARLLRRAFVAAVEVVRARSGGLPDPDGPVEDLEAYAFALREQLERLGRLPRGRRVRWRPVDAGGVPSVWVEHETSRPAGSVVMHLHGGAYAVGSPQTHRGLAATLSRRSGAPVLLPDYRLAPEHAFPAALDDAYAAYRWLIHEQAVTPARVAVTGDSAGGGLAIALLTALRDAGDPLPACCAGLSPWTDLAGTGRSMLELDGIDPWLSAAMARPAARAYAGDHPLDDPLVSPLYADLAGLPPLLVQVGGDEILLDDARRLVDRARAAGVDASLGIFPGLWHVFQAFPGFPESRYALLEIGGFVRRHTIPSSERPHVQRC